MGYAIELQPYITVRSSATPSDVFQDESAYVNTSRFQDVVVWLDVREVDNATTSIAVETAPAKEESLFTAIATFSNVSVGVKAPVAVLFASAAVPVAAWVRWRVYGTSPGATFRIWLVGNELGG